MFIFRKFQKFWPILIQTKNLTFTLKTEVSMKRVKIALTAALALAITFTLNACGGDDNNSDGDGGGSNKCGGEEYTLETQFCLNNATVYTKCNSNTYNPETQYCGNGTVKNYGDPIKDSRDNKTYKTSVIGTQVWMAENLNYGADGSRCYYDDPVNCVKYGRLYDWATAMALDANCNSNNCTEQVQENHRGICPQGWHIPSDNEWKTLTNFVGGTSTAATKLKATNGWKYYDISGNGTDDYGFAALPGGWRMLVGSFSFSHIGTQGHWWGTTDGMNYNYAVSYFTDMMSMSPDTFGPSNIALKESFLSVRCVMD
jgi:uncharacterized protein (TIGR02145 family)